MNTLAIACSGALLAACTGTDVGNPVVDLDFSLHEDMGTSALTQKSVAGATAGLTFNEAWVVVDRIRLREGSDCSGEAQFELQGPFFVDLFGQGTLPALRDIELPGEVFCRFEFRWKAEDTVPSDAPDALRNASLLLSGSRSDGTAFLLRSRRNDEFRLNAKETTFRLTDATGTLFVSFETDRLFTGIDLSVAETGSDGVITIDESSNKSILDQFDSNLADATKLFDDDNNDGELNREEARDEDILAE